MASCYKALLSSSSRPFIFLPRISSVSINDNSDSASFKFNFSSGANLLKKPQAPSFSPNFSPEKYICKYAEPEYQFPDPIPEFADSETEKFRAHLVERFSKRKEVFGDSLEEVVRICSEIFSNFLHTDYGGPGTLLVEPFIDMADTINENGLPGGPQAARVAVKWAQDHVDKDWKQWTGLSVESYTN